MADSLKVLSAYEQSLIREVPLLDAAQVEQRLARAYELFRDPRQWLKPHQRLEILERFHELLQDCGKELAALIVQEGGKPLMDARVEVERAAGGVRNLIEELPGLAGRQIPMGWTPDSEGRLAFTVLEPLGVVLAISAFNHPLNLIIHQALPAVAAGCPCLIKPAPQTPLSCLKVVELLIEAGLPEGWCQACVCDVPEAQRLVEDPRVAFMSFIGSATVGWKLRALLAPGTRCALEHGGAAPVILDQSADLDLTIPALVKGGYYHAGQVCVSVQRVFVPRALIDQISTLLGEQVQALKVGDPALETTQVGPLISPREVQRVGQWVKEAVESGAGLLAGGKAAGETCYQPTLLMDPARDCQVSSKEIFGPVVCLYAYDQVEQALEQANSLPFAFQAAIFARDLDRILPLVKNLDASAVMVNDHSAFRVDSMPFAGRRASGLGIGGMGYTLHEMMHHKMVVLNGY